MHAHSSAPECEASRPARFAIPSQHIFSQHKHVGTVYKWDDGMETTMWFTGSKPIGACLFKPPQDLKVGWRDFFHLLP